MAKKTEEMDWEDQMTEDFQRLVVQDKETGECWSVEEQKACRSTTFPKPDGECIRQRMKSCWKVPKEYSLLGANKTAENEPESIQSIVAAVSKY